MIAPFHVEFGIMEIVQRIGNSGPVVEPARNLRV
jgi:hypothetical protein